MVFNPGSSEEWRCQKDLPWTRSGTRSKTGERCELAGEIHCGVIAADGMAAGIARDEHRNREGRLRSRTRQAKRHGIDLLARNAGNQARLRSEGHVTGESSCSQCGVEAVALPRQAVLIYGDHSTTRRCDARDRRNSEAGVERDDLLIGGGRGGENLGGGR